MTTNHTVTVLAIVASAIAAIPAPAGEIRDRITAEELRQRRAQTQLPRSFQPSGEEGARTEVATRKSIIDNSTILTASSTWTMVPEGSVLYVPPRLRKHIADKPVGTLVPWSRFLRNNIGWLSTENVSVDNAAGRSPITEFKVAALSRRGTVVVAIYRGGAISVNLPKTQES